MSEGTRGEAGEKWDVGEKSGASLSSRDEVVGLEGLRRDAVWLAGGKGANLGELLAAGFPVPPGFCVTTEALFEALPLPNDLAEAILAAYRELGAPPVAIRSSATAEDLPDASFAGQQAMSLNVRGEEEVLEAVLRC
jgi:rifampicin phosphotransferase